MNFHWAKYASVLCIINLEGGGPGSAGDALEGEGLRGHGAPVPPTIGPQDFQRGGAVDLGGSRGGSDPLFGRLGSPCSKRKRMLRMSDR